RPRRPARPPRPERQRKGMPPAPEVDAQLFCWIPSSNWPCSAPTCRYMSNEGAYAAVAAYGDAKAIPTSDCAACGGGGCGEHSLIEMLCPLLPKGGVDRELTIKLVTENVQQFNKRRDRRKLTYRSPLPAKPIE